MTQWYYSNQNRDRLGPISEKDLAELHAGGQIGADTLVWRDGLLQWTPWREVMHEIMPQEVVASVPAAAPSATANPFESTLASTNSNAIPSSRQVAESSPYAPPRAQVSEDVDYVAGGRVVYAGFWKRVAAVIIDGIVTGVIGWFIQLPLLMIMGVGLGGLSSGDPFSSGASVAVMGLYYLVSIAIPLIYYAWMHSSSMQATVGKLAIGIKVTRSDGQRISFWRAFGRYWANALNGFSLGLSWIIVAFTDRKQGVHDMICDTLVVDKHAFTSRTDLQREELGTVTIVVLCLGGLAMLGILALFFVLGAAIFAGLSGVH